MDHIVDLLFEFGQVFLGLFKLPPYEFVLLILFGDNFIILLVLVFVEFDEVGFEILEELFLGIFLDLVNAVVVHLNWSEVHLFLQQVMDIVLLNLGRTQLVS